jgi:hypothetical protein
MLLHLRNVINAPDAHLGTPCAKTGALSWRVIAHQK